ncbi:MAG TPA: glycosyltransferase family 39 protein, partial [Bacteroidia bacterium]|nr:glycosyltransferase family 39 protein [Bacteroidia bacterium]
MEGTNKKNFTVPLLLIMVGALMFLPNLGKVHLFDWDEINFAECAREMIIAKQYFMVTINYLPFWEKPPLFIWMQAFSMSVLGVSDYAARLPNAICGIATLLLLFHVGKTFKDSRFGLLWVFAYVGSILPHFYFKSGIIDPWFNFFIFTGIYFFARYRMQQKNILEGKANKLIILSALCIGLAVLTKGPVALLVFSLTVIIYWLLQNRKAPITFIHASLFALVFILAGGSWFAAEILTGHWATVVEFFQYQVRLFNTGDSGHGGPFYFHFIILLLGCFPASIFAIRGMLIKKDEDAKINEARLWMGILFWVVLILFSIVKTKIIHYSSLCYYPLTFFAALAIYKILFENEAWKKWMSWGLGIIGGIIGIALVGLPIFGMNKQVILSSGIIKDPFAAANLLANVNWSLADCIMGGFLLVTLIVVLVSIRQKKFKMGVFGIFLGT